VRLSISETSKTNPSPPALTSLSLPPASFFARHFALSRAFAENTLLDARRAGPDFEADASTSMGDAEALRVPEKTGLFCCSQ
jgi:hypothetical protein